MAGTGRIYQRGERYFIAYNFAGKEYRESTGSSDIGEARCLLDERLQAVRSAPIPQADRGFTFSDMATLLTDDYTLRDLRTLETVRGRLVHLTAFFAETPAAAIKSTHVRAYQQRRRTVGAAAATVNRETAILHRMLVLAVQAGHLTTVPPFPTRLTEAVPRQGFFEHAEYVQVRQHLPPAYQDVLDFAYYSGWRRREITQLTWTEIDLHGHVVRLDPRRSKTGRGRVLPLTPLLLDVLSRRQAHRLPDSDAVFHHRGIPIRQWRTLWRKACVAAGVPGRHLHDCRRTAARNLVRAGVPERVAMMLLGHLTRSVFDRYNIVSERDLHEAGQRLTAYLATSYP